MTDGMKRNPTITICAVDCIVPELASRAIDLSKSKLPTDDAILFSHKNVNGPHRTVIIDKIESIASYNKFILCELEKFIQTEYVLVVQWDGYVINSNMWNNKFLNYDYIGAVWPQYNDEYRVGNGGFSLRSAKLLKAINQLNIDYDHEENEDIAICRKYRSLLENEHNILFADEDVANRFSYEQTAPINITFGFHGFWNIWRHEDEETIVHILQMMPKYYFSGYLMSKTLMNLHKNKKFKAFHTAFRLAYPNYDLEFLKNSLIYALGFDEKEVNYMISSGERHVFKNKLFSLLKPNRF